MERCFIYHIDDDGSKRRGAAGPGVVMDAHRTAMMSGVVDGKRIKFIVLIPSKERLAIDDGGGF